MELIAEKTKSSITEMARVLGLSLDAIRDQLDRMKDKGTIGRIGPNKGGHWEIIEK